jgi:VWFA-related protein
MNIRRESVAVAAAIGVLALSTSGQDQTVFRARTDIVRVDVSVQERNRPVTGLPASAFSVADNGTPQRIDAMTVEDIPIDVTVVLDVSTEAVQHRRIGEFQKQVARLGALLEPHDRLRVLTDGTYVAQALPWREAQTLVSNDAILAEAQLGGGTSPPDAMAMALMHPVDPTRRHLVIAFTQGIDFFSAIEFARVPSIAARSDAVLHVVLSKIYAGGYARGRLNVPVTAGPLIEAAEMTGGTAHDLGRSLTSTFEQIVGSFRSSYVLTYAPKGVDRPGWHALTVELTVPGAKKYSIRARRGYFSG